MDHADVMLLQMRQKTERKDDMTIDERFACIRCGLRPDGSYFNDLSNCPDNGSSDCPITMGYEDGEACESCRSDEWYKKLTSILSYRGA